MDRQKQVEVMEGAEKRTASHLRKWLANPEVKSALHRPVERPVAVTRGPKRAKAAG